MTAAALTVEMDRSMMLRAPAGPTVMESARQYLSSGAIAVQLGAFMRALGYSESFIRMWEFYLCYCEGGFEERALGDVQMLLAKPANRRPSWKF